MLKKHYNPDSQIIESASVNIVKNGQRLYRQVLLWDKGWRWEGRHWEGVEFSGPKDADQLPFFRSPNYAGPWEEKRDAVLWLLEVLQDDTGRS